MQKVLSHRDRAGHREISGLGAENKVSEGQGSCKGLGAGILRPWGARNRTLAGRGARGGLQGLLQGSMGRGIQLCGSPCCLRVEEC